MGKNDSIEFYNRYYAIRTAYWAVVNFFAALIVIALYLIKPIKFVKLFRIKSERIGHLAAVDQKALINNLKSAFE